MTTIMTLTPYGDPNSVYPHTASNYHPFGEPRGHLIPCIFACHNDRHCQEVFRAMPIYGAMYTPIWANITGRIARKVVVFRPGNWDDMSDGEQERFWRQINTAFVTALHPINEGLIVI